MIELSEFSKKYHQIPVLNIGSWTFKAGLYLLQGINGSGKSTLLQAMAARLPFDGQILVNGISVRKNPRYCRSVVSYSAAEPLFPEFLSGQDLLAFFASTKGPALWQLEALRTEFAADGFLKNATGTYSSGMLKKLALLLAFTGSPRWILLDEPYNGLDQRAATALSLFIEQLYSNNKVNFIISSHQSHQELATGNKHLLLLENGKLHSR